MLPQVTTAQALRNVEWTRTLLRYQRQQPLSHHRFSVLTLGMLRRIHQTFTPEELLDVTLVMQHREALERKVECGRAASRPDRVEAESQYRASEKIPQPGDVQDHLRVHVRVPREHGHRTDPDDQPGDAVGERSPRLCHARRGQFRTGDEFRAFLERTVAAHMRERLGPDDTVRLWDDVGYERLDDGFRLTSRYRSQTVRGGPHHTRLGDLIREGTHTTSEITDELIQAGMPVLDALAWLDRVYQTGVIEEP